MACTLHLKSRFHFDQWSVFAGNDAQGQEGVFLWGIWEDEYGEKSRLVFSDRLPTDIESARNISVSVGLPIRCPSISSSVRRASGEAQLVLDIIFALSPLP